VKATTFSSGSRVARTLIAESKDLTDEEALAKATEIRKQIARAGDSRPLRKRNPTIPDRSLRVDPWIPSRTANGGSVRPGGFQFTGGANQRAVKSPFGYHIHQVEEHNTELRKARPEIEKQIKPQLTRTHGSHQRSIAVNIDGAYFGK